MVGLPAFTLFSEKLQLLVLPAAFASTQLPSTVEPESRVTVPVGFRLPEAGVTVTDPLMEAP